jgi:hypothetical protein
MFSTALEVVVVPPVEVVAVAVFPPVEVVEVAAAAGVAVADTIAVGCGLSPHAASRARIRLNTVTIEKKRMLRFIATFLLIEVAPVCS